jgi:hypothetical protein
MTIVALLAVLVFAAGLVIYLVCAGLTKGSAAKIGEIMFFCGLLAFLLGSGAQSCSMSAGAAGGSAQHR